MKLMPQTFALVIFLSCATPCQPMFKAVLATIWGPSSEAAPRAPAPLSPLRGSHLEPDVIELDYDLSRLQELILKIIKNQSCGVHELLRNDLFETAETLLNMSDPKKRHERLATAYEESTKILEILTTEAASEHFLVTTVASEASPLKPPTLTPEELAATVLENYLSELPTETLEARLASDLLKSIAPTSSGAGGTSSAAARVCTDQVILSALLAAAESKTLSLHQKKIALLSAIIGLLLFYRKMYPTSPDLIKNNFCLVKTVVSISIIILHLESQKRDDDVLRSLTSLYAILAPHINREISFGDTRLYEPYDLSKPIPPLIAKPHARR